MATAGRMEIARGRTLPVDCTERCRTFVESCSWSRLFASVSSTATFAVAISDCWRKVCGQVAKAVWDWVAQVYRPTTQITMERLALTNVECGPVWKCLAMQASSPRCGHRIGVWSVYQLCVWSGNTYRSPAPFDGLIDCPSMHYMFACAWDCVRVAPVHSVHATAAVCADGGAEGSKVLALLPGQQRATMTQLPSHSLGCL